MHKCWLNLNIVVLIAGLFFFSAAAFAANDLGNDFYLDKTKVIVQQIQLLKNRLTQAETESAILQNQQNNQIANLSLDRVSKQWLTWTKLDIAVARSNLDNIQIEVAESQQTINLLEKDVQEIENQLSVYDVFGMNVFRGGIPNLKNMRSQLAYQRGLLEQEKTRLDYLYKLQKIFENNWQIYNARYARIENLLKSQTMMQLKEQQAKSEIDYQQQQKIWLEHLNKLYADLKQLEASKSKDKAAYIKVSNEIFYASENINFMYLQMLIARYQDQIHQYKISISRSSSITLLNKISEQTQSLSKQFIRVGDLLVARSQILEKRKIFLTEQKMGKPVYLNELKDLDKQYQQADAKLDDLNKELAEFRVTLEQSMQQELSSRQGLFVFGTKAWLDLGNELILLPTLAFQMTKSLSQSILKGFASAGMGWFILLGLLEISWVAFFIFLNRFLSRFIVKFPHESPPHINLNWLWLVLLHRNLIDIAIIGNIYWFFSLCGVPTQHFRFLLNIGFVWLLFKTMIVMAKLCLVQTMHDRKGLDVRLYYHLKWTFLVGGVITAIAVFLYHLPLIYEVKDLFYRLFLLFLAVVSLFLLRSWDVLPGLILPHIDERRTYFKKVIRLMGLLFPLVLLVNSLIGVFGFINFVLTISWYESVFLIVMIGYLILRGILSELMEFASRVLIRHVTNGWLWTEAFLKPFDNVLRIILFLMAWVVLFFFYGWDRQSPVVERLDQILHTELVHVLNTSITLLSIIQIVIIASLLYWIARWTREFVYRFLLSRTKDLGIRNSIAILSQYTMILVGILVGLRVLGIDLQALTVVAGAFAFGVGLGLRDIANNFVCGFLLLIERPIRVGDMVTIGGYEGEVMHIGGRAVAIRTWDHTEVLVPNAEIFSKTFMNWTAKDHVVRTVISIKINRLDNPQYVQTLILETLVNQKSILTDPACEVLMKELADDTIEFEIRYFVNLRQIKSRLSVRSEVLIAIWEMFDKNGIKAAHPQHEIHIKSGSMLPPLLAPPG